MFLAYVKTNPTAKMKSNIPPMKMEELNIWETLLIAKSLNALLLQLKLPSSVHELIILNGGGIGFPHPGPQRIVAVKIVIRINNGAIIPAKPEILMKLDILIAEDLLV